MEPFLVVPIDPGRVTNMSPIRAAVPSVGVNVGVNEAILAALVADPTLTAAALAARLGATKRTIERHLAELKAAGRLRREGAPKNGRWMVVPP